MRRRLAAAALTLVALAGPPGRADAANRDLARDERRGGHTLSRHVGLDDDALRERLRREKRIAAASTWTDRRVAEQAVGETLARFADRVRGWSRRGGSRANLVLDYRGSDRRVVGRSLRRGRSRVEACADAVVVLKWLESEHDFFVLTAYPEVRR
jgi:hypothetical protein